MAGSLSILLSTTAILLAISYHLNICSNIKAAAELLVAPLWTNANFTAKCDLDDRFTNDSILWFQRSASFTCSVRIRASEDGFTLLKLPSKINPAFFMYIELEGDTEELECINRFVMIKQGQLACGVLFSGAVLKVQLKGNVSMAITDVPKAHVSFKCPDTDVPNAMNKNSSICLPFQVVGYKKEIYCTSNDENLPYQSCRLNFDPQCTSTLGNRGVTLQCLQMNTTTFEKMMILYPDNLAELDISYNKITSVNSSSFLGLYDLDILNLSDNLIDTIIDDAFHGLYNLQELWLNGNKQTTSTQILSRAQNNSLRYIFI